MGKEAMAIMKLTLFLAGLALVACAPAMNLDSDDANAAVGIVEQVDDVLKESNNLATYGSGKGALPPAKGGGCKDKAEWAADCPHLKDSCASHVVAQCKCPATCGACGKTFDEHCQVKKGSKKSYSSGGKAEDTFDMGMYTNKQ